MDHYVCTGGCAGVSDKPGTCQADTCVKYGKSLDPCNCSDGQHTVAFEKAKEEEEI